MASKAPHHKLEVTLQETTQHMIKRNRRNTRRSNDEGTLRLSPLCKSKVTMLTGLMLTVAPEQAEDAGDLEQV